MSQVFFPLLACWKDAVSNRLVPSAVRRVFLFVFLALPLFCVGALLRLFVQVGQCVCVFTCGPVCICHAWAFVVFVYSLFWIQNALYFSLLFNVYAYYYEWMRSVYSNSCALNKIFSEFGFIFIVQHSLQKLHFVIWIPLEGEFPLGRKGMKHLRVWKCCIFQLNKL